MRRWHFTGLAVPFDAPTWVDGKREMVACGAFARRLKEGACVVALISHKRSSQVAMTTDGSLVLSESVRGLHFQIDAADTEPARIAAEGIRSGKIQGMSFGWYPASSAYANESRHGWPTKVLRDADFFEVSFAYSPRYFGTSVHVVERWERDPFPAIVSDHERQRRARAKLAVRERAFGAMTYG